MFVQCLFALSCVVLSVFPFVFILNMFIFPFQRLRPVRAANGWRGMFVCIYTFGCLVYAYREVYESFCKLMIGGSAFPHNTVCSGFFNQN
ncbi:hypothetical protein DPX39_090019900 [Trypanosoma brucei equiperdum]|uniref:Uncharacterized protein n=1 Tax=Trypanosoma brucei equiperdum TaxID=630700 RepID=A0A3L6L0G9_9TRYP|nr:hypothetical protein DPX39_090019900 [Trypanosoma brucei equiperdum]